MTLTRKRDHFFPTAWNELFDNNFFNTPTTSQRGITVPAVNIKEDENGYAIEMAAPGMEKSDFKIHLDHNLLTISTEKEQKTDHSKDNYTRKEYSFSSFSRSFTLPDAADKDKIDAAYTAGVLKIMISKREEAKPKPTREIQIG